MFGILFDVHRQRGLHVVRVVLDVVVLQCRLQASALLLPARLGTRHFGRQAFFVGSSDCCPGGRLLASMISSIVFLTDPPFSTCRLCPSCCRLFLVEVDV